MVNANLNFSIFSIFPLLLESQLPTLAPRLRRNQERFVAENKTPRCYQYWLVGFRIWDWSTNEKVSEINDLGQNFHWRSGVKTFCILARLRRVLRTISDKIEILHEIMFLTLETELKWCEALSEVGPICKKSWLQIATNNFDLKYWGLIPFVLWINLKF